MFCIVALTLEHWSMKNSGRSYHRNVIPSLIRSIQLSIVIDIDQYSSYIVIYLSAISPRPTAYTHTQVKHIYTTLLKWCITALPVEWQLSSPPPRVTSGCSFGQSPTGGGLLLTFRPFCFGFLFLTFTSPCYIYIYIYSISLFPAARIITSHRSGSVLSL